MLYLHLSVGISSALFEEERLALIKFKCKYNRWDLYLWEQGNVYVASYLHVRFMAFS